MESQLVTAADWPSAGPGGSTTLPFEVTLKFLSMLAYVNDQVRACHAILPEETPGQAPPAP